MATDRRHKILAGYSSHLLFLSNSHFTRPSETEYINVLVDRISLIRSKDFQELAANINGFRVWMRFPADIQVTESPEPFLPIAFLEALTQGGTLKVDSDIGISRTFASNFDLLQMVFLNWNDELKHVTLECKTTDARAPIQGIASMYSAGVDSMYTLLRHRDEITHLLRMFGYDFMDDPAVTAQIIEHDQAFANQLGKRYVPIVTNFREYMYDRKIDNYTFAGFPLFSISLALGLATYFIPSTHTYSELYPGSTHPLTDPMWSNGQIDIVHDYAVRRSDKINLIAQSSEFLDKLHVCWKLPVGNCGSCSKCIRTAITLQLMDIKTDKVPVDSAFEHLDKLTVSDDSGLSYLVDNLQLARERNNTEVFRRLKRKIRQYQRVKLLSQMDDVFLDGLLRKLYRRVRKPEWLTHINLLRKERLY